MSSTVKERAAVRETLREDHGATARKSGFELALASQYFHVVCSLDSDLCLLFVFEQGFL